MKGAPGPHRKSYHQQVLRDQMDAAAAHEARRRQQARPREADSGELWRSLAGLLFGLIAIGVVVYVAWSAGIFG